MSPARRTSPAQSACMRERRFAMAGRPDAIIRKLPRMKHAMQVLQSAMTNNATPKANNTPCATNRRATPEAERGEAIDATRHCD